LQAALDDLLYAMDVWATLNNLAPRGTFAATYDFDDSVITDKEIQMAQDRQAVTMGVMPKWMYLTRNYGLDEVTAKAWISDVTTEQPMDLFGGAPK
jgi:A118 family predicted phage portal protein